MKTVDDTETHFILDWNWMMGEGKGENRYECSTCKSKNKKHKVVFEIVGHSEYTEPISRRRCTGCGFEEKNRWIPAGW